ncbi:MAG TPA: NADH-quinone oxidoreductase subunit J [Candidatus Dormibacteraeota bacterium]|nr:NADH-quinone oxidoreductase subunit J [Candidatus Dormibacteraeota bacterium]
MITAIFFIASLLALLGAVGVVLFRNPIASVLSLVLVMFALSVHFLLLSAQFLFAVQIIVYAGAVMVLFLFVIALLGPGRELATSRLPRQGWLAVVFAAGFAVLLVSLLGNLTYHQPASTNLDLFGTVEQVAIGLFTTYLYPFELTSLILLVAAVGAIYLSREHRS